MSDLNSAVAYDDGRNHSPTAMQRYSGRRLYSVSSIFGPTIQGEGPYAGQPAVFVRLAGCNRGDKTSAAGCRWCDADFRVDHSKQMTSTNIVNRCYELFLHKDRPPLVVITGGEPLLHDCCDLVDDLIDAHCRVQFETNGDYPHAALLDMAEKGWNAVHKDRVAFVISPKIGNANRGYAALKRNWTPLIVGRTPVFLKALISADSASAYYDPHPAVLNLATSKIWKPEQIYLSPLAIYRQPLPDGHIVNFLTDTEYLDREATAANYARAAQLAIRYNVRLSLQTHQLLGVQ